MTEDDAKEMECPIRIIGAVVSMQLALLVQTSGPPVDVELINKMIENSKNTAMCVASKCPVWLNTDQWDNTVGHCGLAGKP